MDSNNIYILFFYFHFVAILCCDSTWKYYQGSCYYFPANSKTRQDAGDFCAEEGGALAIISSPEESYFITTQTVEAAVIDENYYVQGDDMDSEGIFLHDDKTTVNYQDWMSNNPDDYNNQDCITLELDADYFQQRKQMNDRDCYSDYHFLCEKPDDGNCGSDWVTYEGSCFYFSTLEKTYADSIDHCESLGASPPIISSLEELEFVSFARSDTWDNRYWIQGNDKSNEDTFVYDDGSTMSFVDWVENEPNDDGGQDCVVLDRLPRRKMNDKSCDDARFFVCEKRGSHYVAVNKGTLPGKYSVGRCASKCDGDSMCIAFSIGPNDGCYPMTTQCANEDICYIKV